MIELVKSLLIDYRPWAGLAFAASLPTVLLLRGGRGVRWSERAVRLARLPAAAAVAWLLLLAWGYLAYPGYLDHAEAMVASVAWLLDRGEPLYHALDAPERYTILYGPLLYEAGHAVMALLGPSLWASKLPGALALTATLGAAGLALHRGGRPWRETLAPLGLLAFLLLYFLQYSFWNRPDPAILALSALAAWLALGGEGASRSPAPRALALGLLGGLLLHLKAHAAVYAAPWALFYLLDAGRPLRVVAAGALGAAAGLLLPLLPAGISLPAYLAWLQAAVGHGLSLELLVLDLALGSALLVPLALLAGRAWPVLGWPDRALVLSFGLAVLAVCLVAAKPGSGPHHLMPFLPGALVLGDRLLRRQSPGRAPAALRLRVRTGLLLLVLAFLPAVAVNSVFVLANLGQVTALREARGEIESALARHPGRTLAMGYGGEASYHKTALRPLLVFAGQPYLLDAVAMMDMKKSGLALPDTTLRALSGCRFDLWLIPAGEAPFSKRDFYSGAALFDDALVEAFREAYARVEAGRHFDLWACRR